MITGLSVGSVFATIGADMKPFDSAIGQVKARGLSAAQAVEDRFQRIGDRMSGLGRTMTRRFTLPIVAGLTAATREAAILEGATAKFDVVFRGLNSEMNEFVESFRDEFPIARREIIASAASLQDLLVPMGINRREAAGMTREWMELAGALSAFNDVPITQALDAIQSGIAGQSRPLRQFGIDVRETVLQQVALEEGLISAGQAMSEQVRQQALLIQATRQSQDAIGGLEEQKGSLLWVTQGLMADLRDLGATIGQDLIPLVIQASGRIRNWIRNFSDLDAESRRSIMGMVGLLAATGPLALAIGTMAKIIAAFASLVRRKFLIVTAAFLGLVGAVQWVRDNWDTLLSRIESSVGEWAQGVTGWLGRVWDRFRELRDEMGAIIREGMEFKRSQDDLVDGAKEGEKQFTSFFDSMKDGLKVIMDFIDETVGASDALQKLLDLLDDPKTEDIEDDLERIRVGMESIKDEIVEDIPALDIDMGPLEGSLAHLEERLHHLTEFYRHATTDASREATAVLIDATEKQINAIRRVDTEARRTYPMFEMMAVQAFDRAAFAGENLLGILASLARQLASRVLLTGLRLLIGGPASIGGSFLGAVFGGNRANGGRVMAGGAYRVGERGPEMFVPNVGGRIIPQSSPAPQVSPAQMEQAFSRALGRYASRLGPDEVFALAQAGGRSYGA